MTVAFAANVVTISSSTRASPDTLAGIVAAVADTTKCRMDAGNFWIGGGVLRIEVGGWLVIRNFQSVVLEVTKLMRPSGGGMTVEPYTHLTFAGGVDASDDTQNTFRGGFTFVCQRDAKSGRVPLWVVDTGLGNRNDCIASYANELVNYEVDGWYVWQRTGTSLKFKPASGSFVRFVTLYRDPAVSNGVFEFQTQCGAGFDTTFDDLTMIGFSTLSTHFGFSGRKIILNRPVFDRTADYAIAIFHQNSSGNNTDHNFDIVDMRSAGAGVWNGIFTTISGSDSGNKGGNVRVLFTDKHRFLQGAVAVADVTTLFRSNDASGAPDLNVTSGADGRIATQSLLYSERLGSDGTGAVTPTPKTWSLYAKKYTRDAQPSYALFEAVTRSATDDVVQMTVDGSITQVTKATVDTYTAIDTLDKLYDRAVAFSTDNLSQAPVVSGDGINADFGARNIVIDATAATVFAYSTTGVGTVTFKAASLAAGTKFIKLVTTGTITFSNGAAPSATLVYQSSAGTSVPVTAPNLIAGSRVQIFDVPNAVELANVAIGSGGYVGRFIWSVDKIIRLRANFQSGVTGKLPVESTANLTNLGASFLAAQDNDTVYATNGIDGSTVTEFAADYPNIQMDITDPDGVTSVQRIYAWWRSNSTTSTGIANFFKGLVAEDAINYRINTSIVNLKLDNRNVAPVIIAGGRIYRDNATTVIAAASGSIQMDPDKAYSVETGVSGLTAPESALLASITPIRNLIEADEIHTSTTVQKKLKGTATVLLTKNISGIPLNTFQAIQ